jgi:hypothetical protein
MFTRVTLECAGNFPAIALFFTNASRGDGQLSAAAEVVTTTAVVTAAEIVTAAEVVTAAADG